MNKNKVINKDLDFPKGILLMMWFTLPLIFYNQIFKKVSASWLHQFFSWITYNKKASHVIPTGVNSGFSCEDLFIKYNIFQLCLYVFKNNSKFRIRIRFWMNTKTFAICDCECFCVLLLKLSQVCMKWRSFAHLFDNSWVTFGGRSARSPY